jgi:uncharacterized integral membrane protein
VSVRLGVVLALGFGVLVAYLASLNTSRVRVVLTGDRGWEVPLAALVVGAFLAGVALTLVGVLLRDLGRSVRRHRQDRASRREAPGPGVAGPASAPGIAGEKGLGSVHEGMAAPERLTSQEIPAVRSEAGAGAAPTDIPRA